MHIAVGMHRTITLIMAITLRAIITGLALTPMLRLAPIGSDTTDVGAHPPPWIFRAAASSKQDRTSV